MIRWVIDMARASPWYGYKKIAIMCRRAGQPVKNRQAYRVMAEAGPDAAHLASAMKDMIQSRAINMAGQAPGAPRTRWPGRAAGGWQTAGKAAK